MKGFSGSRLECDHCTGRESIVLEACPVRCARTVFEFVVSIFADPLEVLGNDVLDPGYYVPFPWFRFGNSVKPHNRRGCIVEVISLDPVIAIIMDQLSVNLPIKLVELTRLGSDFQRCALKLRDEGSA